MEIELLKLFSEQNILNKIVELNVTKLNINNIQVSTQEKNVRNLDNPSKIFSFFEQAQYEYIDETSLDYLSNNISIPYNFLGKYSRFLVENNHFVFNI
jgi:hypothetical protein